VAERVKAPPNKRATAPPGAPAADGRSRSLWFNPPMNDQDRRPQLTRQRIVTEALAVIAQDGLPVAIHGKRRGSTGIPREA
jgi:hypothetical protein